MDIRKRRDDNNDIQDNLQRLKKYTVAKTYPLARLSFISPLYSFVSNNTFVPLDELDNPLDDEEVEGAEFRTKLNSSV